MSSIDDVRLPPQFVLLAATTMLIPYIGSIVQIFPVTFALYKTCKEHGFKFTPYQIAMSFVCLLSLTLMTMSIVLIAKPELVSNRDNNNNLIKTGTTTWALSVALVCLWVLLFLALMMLVFVD